MSTHFRDHPVVQAIRTAAYFGPGGMPSNADLDALNLKPANRRAVVEACEAVAAIHDTGHHAKAWAAADDAAGEILDRLDDGEGVVETPRPGDGVTDPAELAALVAPTKGLR
jgi:hypothetical protein